MTAIRADLSKWIALLLVWLCTIEELRAINLEHWSLIPTYEEITRQLLTGTPPSKAFQNRLLGPLLVAAVRPLFHHSDYDSAYKTVTSLILLSVNLLTYYCLLRLRSSRFHAVLYTAAGVAAFILLQDRTWLYIWDYIDLLFLTLFCYGVYRQWAVLPLLLLMIAEAANREIAIWLALWMLVDGIWTWENHRIVLRGKFDWVKICTGLSASIIFVAWTLFIRDRLYRHAMVGYLPIPNSSFGNIFTLPSNVVGFFKYSFSTTPAFDFLAYWIPPVLVYWLWRNRNLYSKSDFRLAAVLALLILPIAFTAVIIETRVYLCLIPPVVFLARSLYTRKANIG